MNNSQDIPVSLPINRQICFSKPDNIFDEGVKKRQLKILKNLVPQLRTLLEQDEEILYAVRAFSPFTTLDHLLSNWYFYLTKQCALVFTNYRILHFPVKTNGKPKNSHSQIRYGDLEAFTVGGAVNRVVNLTYRSRRKEKFSQIKIGDLKKIEAMHALYLKESRGTEVKERHYLCPKCSVALHKDKYQCPNCRFSFKNQKTALKNALIFPGGGFFYARNLFLGIQYGIIESILLALIILTLARTIDFNEMISAVVGMAVILFVSKLIHIYHALRFIREYIPTEKDFTPAR